MDPHRPATVDHGPATGEASDALDVNEYFDAHPDHILGRLTAGRGMYREHELTVEPTGPLAEQLDAALHRIVTDARSRGATLSPAPSSASSTRPQPRAADGRFEVEFAEDGSFVSDQRGAVGRLTGGSVVAYEPRVAKDKGELIRLVGLRDAARSVLAVQVDGGNEEDLQTAQRLLGDRYRSYVRVYGPINRTSQARTGRRDPKTGAEILRRVRPRMGGFRDDPDWPLVAALEVFDDDSQEARPAAIFTERVVDPPHERLGVNTPDEAVAVCLDETGTVTLDRATEFLGCDADTARLAKRGRVESLDVRRRRSGQRVDVGRRRRNRFGRSLADGIQRITHHLPDWKKPEVDDLSDLAGAVGTVAPSPRIRRVEAKFRDVSHAVLGDVPEKSDAISSVHVVAQRSVLLVWAV